MVRRRILLGRVKRTGGSFLLLFGNLEMAGVRAGLAGRVTALSPVEVAGLPLRGIAGERERERPDGERHRQKRRYDDYGKEPGRPTDFQEITFWGGVLHRNDISNAPQNVKPIVNRAERLKIGN